MNDINECKPVPYSITAMINKNDSVTIQEYEKRGNRFYDVTTRINGVVKFIGRYYKELDPINIAYKNGKVIIYSSRVNEKTGVLEVNKIYSLYNVEDDVMYSCNTNEAIKEFNSMLKFNIKNDEVLHRSDVEKIRRYKK